MTNYRNFMKGNSRTGGLVSSAIVNQNQGGGSRKAGFPYIVGRYSWTTHYFAQHHLDRPLVVFRMNTRPDARPSRPVGSDPRLFSKFTPP